MQKRGKKIFEPSIVPPEKGNTETDRGTLIAMGLVASHPSSFSK